MFSTSPLDLDLWKLLEDYTKIKYQLLSYRYRLAEQCNGHETNIPYKGGAGVVVFRRHDGEIQVLLVEDKRPGYFGFPKGGHEKGETWTDTAWRELYEEAGVEKEAIKVITNQYIDEINLRGHISVRYIIGECKNGDITLEIKDPDEEILSIQWTDIKRDGESFDRRSKPSTG
eukprot:TRINITY_DN2465_c0_g1_i3.p1 TRINITY_DN2465_c0_g1~~TRINITY_DN2465_c0_g1_i3.p1  ORF type:complete len:173 (-),score=29.74 TRINITY_DN2465_c0_g1_i3:187-705(-)